MNNRLVSVTPAIKAHPLWPDSKFELEFNYGGVTVNSVRVWLANKERVPDLTPRERTFMMLWREAIAGEAE